MSEKFDYAEVLVQLFTREPVEIARPFLSRLEFRVCSGRLTFVSHEMLPGIRDMGGTDLALFGASRATQPQ